MRNLRPCLVCLLLLVVIAERAAWKWNYIAKTAVACSFFCGASCYPVLADLAPPAVLAPSFQTQIKELQQKGVTIPVETVSLKDQLKDIQREKLAEQKTMRETDEEALMSRQLTYPEGKLVARGVVTLEVKPESELGYYSAAELDPAYSSDSATLFVLGVARDGPPLAAKRYKVNELKFPLTFELTTADLLFPYNENAWLASDARKDSIATTALISSGNAISKPTTTERYGFGLSDPVVFAGQVTRTASKMNVVGKVDGTLYTPEDVALLASIDKGLDAKEAAAKETKAGKK